MQTDRSTIEGEQATRGVVHAMCTCGHGHGFSRCPNTGGVSQACHVSGCDCEGFTLVAAALERARIEHHPLCSEAHAQGKPCTGAALAPRPIVPTDNPCPDLRQIARNIRERRRQPRYRGSRLQLSDAQSDRVRETYRQAQQRAGSQMALAAQLGCSQQSVSSVFSARVSLAMAALLSMHLRVLVADLVGEP